MHRHVIVTREHHRESDGAAEQLVQIAGLENCPVRQLVLRGIQEVHGDTKAEPGGDHPPASHGQIMQIAKHQNRTDMAAKLQRAGKVRLGIQFLELGSAQKFARGKALFHVHTLFIKHLAGSTYHPH